jgi:hypothetical protein
MLRWADPLTAEVDLCTVGQDPGKRTSADTVPRFEYRDSETMAADFPCRAQPGEAGSNNRHVDRISPNAHN